MGAEQQGRAPLQPYTTRIPALGQFQRVLVIEVDDERLTWPERELVRQLGEKLYGNRPKRQETRHG